MRYLITSALPYASGITHLGNVVGSTLPADIYARYCRLRGRQTLYVCGSDEHGVAITIAAEKEGVTPQELVNRYHVANEQALRAAWIDFDVFGRTTDPLHAQTAQEFFTVWLNNGLLTKKEEDQFFDEQAGMFLPDRYVEGVCPNCGFDRARGDQCDNCGAYYNQLDLKNPRSVVTGKVPVVKKTSHWYFTLNAFQEWTEQYIEAHAGEWKDNVLQQSRSWLKQGLAERAATRDMPWGVPVPLDGAEGKVLYVWFEAVLGYISATKRWAEHLGNAEAWKQWWMDTNTAYTAFLGKDNIVFHTIIFPILLHTRESEGYILPTNVPANEFLNLEGQKFSKSRNWAIDLAEYLSRFPDPQYVDVPRYVLTMNMPETKDSDFTWTDFQARTNNELAAILGNFVNRVSQFLQRYFNGVVPQQAEHTSGDHEEALSQALQTAMESVGRQLDAFRFRDAATNAMNAARAANKYFNDRAPWKDITGNPERAAHTIYVCVNAIRSLAILFAPFIPVASTKMQLMFADSARVGSVNESSSDIWTTLYSKTCAPGTVVTDPGILFNKVEDSVVQQQRELLVALARPSESQDANTTPTITIDRFSEISLRTARVLSAEPVPKSKKLLRLIVDLGTEKRQILAGIAQHYSPEDIVGTLVVVVANLQPAKLMGLESQGMVLAASNSSGQLTLVRPADLSIGEGAEVR